MLRLRHHRRTAACLAAAALLAAACSADRDDLVVEATPTPTSSPAPSATAGPAVTVVPEVVRFGDLESPCGGGDASQATAQGVTASTITIGYGDDAGFVQAPGLNKQQSDAMRAMIAWCNEQGGINGREVRGNYYDAKLFEVNNVMLAACGEVFMLVGQGFSADSAQEEARVGCGLGSVAAWAVSPEFAHGPFAVQPVPNPADVVGVQVAAAIARAFPDQITKTALMYANYPATIDTKDKVAESFPAFGFEFLPCDQQYNIGGEDDWRTFVQNLKSCGAEVVYFTGSPNPNFQNFLSAAAQLDYSPIYITAANFYDDGFARWNAQNGGAADDVYVQQVFAPLEEADSNPAVRAYLDAVDATGGEVNQLGAQAASAFLLWATATRACGDALTRDCVLSEIAAITEWTGGGLHAVANPATNLPPECGLTLKLDGGRFVRVDPTGAGDYDCSPDYIKQVTGQVVDRVRLDADRVSTIHLP